MNTKLAYVLTSNEKDIYLEQAVLSIYSAKLYNPSAKITLVVDNSTFETIKGQRNIIKEYVTEIIPVEVPLDLSNMQMSRFLKTKLREIIEGDFLYIDTDTIIADDLSEIDDWDIEIGGVADCHLPIREHIRKDTILKIAKEIDWEIPQKDTYINGGVLFVRDTPMSHRLFSEWHRLWLTYSQKFNLFIDMPPLAKANANCGYPIKEISGIYNCQIIENGLRFLSEAKIIHYFASNMGRYDCPYIFRDPNVYKTIKQKGVTDELKIRLTKPKSAFLTKCTILGGNQCDIYKSPFAGIARRLSLKFPRLNHMLERFIKL